jgi:hypothetical protein
MSFLHVFYALVATMFRLSNFSHSCCRFFVLQAPTTHCWWLLFVPQLPDREKGEEPRDTALRTALLGQDGLIIPGVRGRNRGIQPCELRLWDEDIHVVYPMIYQPTCNGVADIKSCCAVHYL